ncbi:MAG TPA: ribbon-helix-helix protein, CopG family [Acidimicrobiales bacterium]|nr:ribbon-helix-helix protein, CopG family [Acidimicrobiales bacterium]
MLVMPRAVSVRLDEDAIRALRIIEATGLSRSEAIRAAIMGQAGRLREPASLAAEVAALEANETDRAEMAIVASIMEEGRAPW